ncbi:MAG: hypothetical protein AAFR38_03930 [Planctomycetota bacterium]
MIAGLARVLALSLCACIATLAPAQGVNFEGSLENADVRYPPSLPNDVEIVLYGPDLSADAVRRVWNTDILLRDPDDPMNRIGLEWGLPTIEEDIDLDPNSETFGMVCLTIRWQGPERPDLVGKMVHIGVTLRNGFVPVRSEIWWTRDGQRLNRPCDPRIRWFCWNDFWVICIENNTPRPFYLYGCRWFAPPVGATLPQLEQLTFENLENAPWTALPPPPSPFGPVFCLQPKCRIYLTIPVRRWRPVIFQWAARNTPEPLQFPLDVPEPRDWLPDPSGNPDGGLGTVFIGQSRAVQTFQSDLNGDGIVNILDVGPLRQEFDMISQDVGGTVPLP